MSPRLLLAFLNYNTAEELREALLSLPAAREGVDCDVVIIDNASPKPGETEKLEALKGDARLVRTEENLGFAGAFNKVLPKKGDDPASFPYDYVLLLNSDLILPPGFLRDLVEALRNLPALGLAGISFTREDGSPQFSYGPTPTLTSELINRSLFQKRYRKTHASPDGRPIEVVLFRRFICCFSVAKSCLTLQPLDYSMPGSPSFTVSWSLFKLMSIVSDAVCPTTTSSVAPFSCPQLFPALGSFPVSQLFPSGVQSIGGSASVLPINIQG